MKYEGAFRNRRRNRLGRSGNRPGRGGPGAARKRLREILGLGTSEAAQASTNPTPADALRGAIERLRSKANQEKD